MTDAGASEVAGAVADGHLSARRLASLGLAESPPPVTAQLLALAPLTASDPLSIPSGRRLPWALEVGRVVAAVTSIAGAVGLYALTQEEGGRRYGLFLAGLGVFAAAALYLDVAGRDRRARALALCLWTNAASFAPRGIVALADAWTESTVLPALMLLRPEAFFSCALWTFSRDFPETSDATRLDRVTRVGVGVTTGLAVALLVLNLLPLVAAAASHQAWLVPVLFDRQSGVPDLFWTLTFGTAAPALVVIALKARAAVPADRRRITFFMYGVAASLLPLTLEVVAENLIPPLFRIMDTPAGRYWGGWLVYPPVFLLPVAAAYAVAVGDVLPFRIAMRQFVRYVGTRWLLTLAALVPIAMLAGRVLANRQHAIGELVAAPGTRGIAIAAAIGAIALLFRVRILRTLDRWLSDGRTDPAVTLSRLSDRLHASRTPLEAAAALARAASSSLRCGSTIVMVRNGHFERTDSRDARPPRQSVMAVLLAASQNACCVGAAMRRSHYDLLSDDDRRWIDTTGAGVLVPVFAGRQEAGLVALVALGARADALTFSDDDMRLLHALGAATSLACGPLHPPDSEPGEAEVGLECTACGTVSVWAEAHACTCGGSLQPARVPALVAGRFEVTARLGAGGMGIVYRATDLTLSRDVALKTLTSLSDGAAARLLIEARTMAALAHPHLAVLYGTERWRRTPLLVIEYLAGGTLAARLRDGPLTPAEAVALAAALADALVYLHGQGLFHGDIKPSNIGFTADRHPKFLDFGLTAAFERREASEGAHLETSPLGGTRAYLPPEVLAGDRAGPAVDLWALAMVLYESVTGRLFQAENRPANQLADAVSGLDIAWSEGLARFLTAAFAEDPGRRPRGAPEVRRALLDLAARAAQDAAAIRGVRDGVSRGLDASRRSTH